MLGRAGATPNVPAPFSRAVFCDEAIRNKLTLANLRVRPNQSVGLGGLGKAVIILPVVRMPRRRSKIRLRESL